MCMYLLSVTFPPVICIATPQHHLVFVYRPLFYGSQLGVMINSAPRTALRGKSIVFTWLSVKTHLISFFSSKLIGRSRMARTRSCVDRATSSLTRFCSSVTHKMTRQALPVTYTQATIQSTDQMTHFTYIDGIIGHPSQSRTTLHLIPDGILCES